jgi:ferredoxin
MPEKRRLEEGDVVTIQKPAFDDLLRNIQNAGFQPVGPKVSGNTVVYGELESLSQLPKGYVTEQAPGHFRLVPNSRAGYFDFIPGAQSWKQFLLPPVFELLRLKKEADKWSFDGAARHPRSYAFIGVRACELAAIQTQDRVFLRSDFSDAIYRARRAKVFVLAVNCLHPAGTCFCSSMLTGPRVQPGYDLCLTELDDVFLLAIGSELGRSVCLDIPCEPANAFTLDKADRAIDEAAQAARSPVDASRCADDMMQNLEDPHWEDVAARCLSCGNCTMVCPTCFCWDVTDRMNLVGTETCRERAWDSCFNPGYSYQSGGNTRPSIKSRYRQWLSHKFGAWKQQFGTLGCVGCGRCITWCPAGIDTRLEVAAMQREAGG